MGRFPIGEHFLRLFRKTGPYIHLELHDVRSSAHKVEFVPPRVSNIYARHTPRRLETETSHLLFRYSSQEQPGGIIDIFFGV